MDACRHAFRLTRLVDCSRSWFGAYALVAWVCLVGLEVHMSHKEKATSSLSQLVLCVCLRLCMSIPIYLSIYLRIYIYIYICTPLSLSLSLSLAF